MITRVITALIGLSIVLPTLIWGELLGFKLLMMTVILLATDEYLRMMAKDKKRSWPIVFVVYLASGFGWMQYPDHSMSLFASACVVLWISAIQFSKTNEEGLRLAARYSMGLLYVPFMLSQLYVLRDNEQGLSLIIFCLVCTWAADTGAYFAGRAFGKNKLAPRLSPNKTWEGAIGGSIAAIVGGLLMNHYTIQFPILHIVVLAIVLDVVSVIGDLFESMLKRSVAVKDSGWVMPGHGGVLDRVDSLIFTAPVALVYLTTFSLI